MNDEAEVLEVPELVAVVQEVDLPAVPAQLPGPNGVEILDVPDLVVQWPEVQRRRETARVWIAGILGVAFLLTVGWVLATATFGEGTAWANTKEALQILLPVESSLLGAAVVFYFTGSGEQQS